MRSNASQVPIEFRNTSWNVFFAHGSLYHRETTTICFALLVFFPSGEVAMCECCEVICSCFHVVGGAIQCFVVRKATLSCWCSPDAPLECLSRNLFHFTLQLPRAEVIIQEQVLLLL